jgi:hypothetical protein
MDAFEREIANRVIEMAELRAENARLRGLLIEAKSVLDSYWDNYWFSTVDREISNKDDVINISHKIDAALTPSAAPIAPSQPSDQ